MHYLMVFTTAMVISMLVIPAMVRFAPRLGLIDEPDPRKIHQHPVPRVGGWGIVLGAIMVLLMTATLDKLTVSYICGSTVLFAFGVWDDRCEIGHYFKFVGQLIAVSIIVFYGDLYVTSFPFIGDESLPPIVGIAFTVFAMVGMINAINHSDGLDGLAAGESLFSLTAIAFLLHLSSGDAGLLIALATIGGTFGFLRYNTHPAQVFMGDGGSQFLGFTLGFLAILLTQEVNPDLSPAVVALLLGFPIADILVVLFKRIQQRMNWFQATRNHVHHRLLDLGFVHQESVIVIYSLQALLVTSGVLLRYEPDRIILLLYLLVCTILFGWLAQMEKLGWRAHQRRPHNHTGSFGSTRSSRMLIVAPRRFLTIAIPLYLLGISFSVGNVPYDIGMVSALIVMYMLFGSAFHFGVGAIAWRALIYATCATVVYLGVRYPPTWFLWSKPAEAAFFLLIVVGIAVAVKTSPGRRKMEFRTSATDYFVIFILLASTVISGGYFWNNHVIVFILQTLIIFYACELLIIERRKSIWNGLSLSSLTTLVVLSVRGLF